MDRTIKQTLEMASNLLRDREGCDFSQRVAAELDSLRMVPLYINHEYRAHGEQTFEVSTRRNWPTDEEAVLLYASGE